MPYLATLTVSELGRPLTVNGQRRHTGRAWASQVNKWRNAAFILAAEQRLQRMDKPAVITAVPRHKNGRSPQDTGACYPALKAAIDGLVDYGVLAGDGAAHVRTIVLTAPLRGPYDGLDIHLSEWEGHDS